MFMSTPYLCKTITGSYSMAYSNSDEIFITMHADDKEAFYAKIPYDKLPSIHRIGG